MDTTEQKNAATNGNLTDTTEQKILNAAADGNVDELKRLYDTVVLNEIKIESLKQHILTLAGTKRSRS